MKKVPVVTVYRYYFGIFKKEIKIQHKIINGKVVFEEKPRKTDTVIITYKYEE